MSERLPIITISREYAAYGRTIASQLSERLGIPFYDRDFVKKTAEDSGYAVEDIEKEGEEISKAGRLLDSILNNASSYTSSHDGIFSAQRKVVLNLAKEPCIIVGRCAGHILREEGIPSFDIFLYADMDARIKRATELGEGEGQDMKKYVKKRDELRETYYRQYTHKEMGDSHEYDVCLNVGQMGVENCVNALVHLIHGLN